MGDLSTAICELMALGGEGGSFPSLRSRDLGLASFQAVPPRMWLFAFHSTLRRGVALFAAISFFRFATKRGFPLLSLTGQNDLIMLFC